MRPEDWQLLGWTVERTPALKWLTHEYMGLRPNTAQYADETGPDVLHAELERLSTHLG